MKIGVKLYSTDVRLIEEVVSLYKRKFLNYIELYIIPCSYQETIRPWKECNIPFVIHAPHSGHGINLAQAHMWESNRRKFNEAQLFADTLKSDIIIVHGGHSGRFDETLRQITLLGEERIVLENKPKIGLHNEECVGWSPSEFRRAQMAGVLYRLALDFGHAACAARSIDIDMIEMLEEFMVLDPEIFHLSDGDTFSERDIHLNLGQGNFDIRKLLSFVDDGGLVTIETPRSSGCGLEDFIEDVRFLRGFLIKC